VPRLQALSEAIYTCPRCKQTVKRTLQDFDTPRLREMFGGRLPAYLVCGRCSSWHPETRAPLMWRTDIKPIDRKASLWGYYGSRAANASRPTQQPFSEIQDVSFAKCYRYVIHRITPQLIKDTHALLGIAQDAVSDVKISKRKKLNAVAIHFSTSTEKASRGQHYAIIDWAPGGIWANADTVKPGFYTTHKYTIVRQHQTKKKGGVEGSLAAETTIRMGHPA